jgi:dipeptidase D
VFTVDEETGMYGAEGLDATRLKSHTLINIDSEAEGIFTVGCAGGARCTVKKQVKYLDKKMSAVTVKVSGLVGGHSGVEINRGRLNANFVMAKVIYEISKNFPMYIKEINGGSKDNVITRECDAVICCEESVEKIKAVADKVKSEFYCETDSGLRIEIKKADDCVPFNEKVSRDVLGVLKDLKQGILKMSEHIKGLPQTSQNLGVIKTEGDVIKFTYSVRSSVNTERDEALEDIKELAENNGFEYSYTGVYPAWEYRENSPLRDKMVNVFKELYHKEPVIEVIHAGLECGLLGEKIKGLDAVSFGPDLFDIHTSRERMSIASVKRTYAFLKELIKNL